MKPQDDTQTIAVGMNGANANSPNVGPGANLFIDTYLQQGKDDKYVGVTGTAIRVGTDKKSDTAANNGGTSFYPGANLADIKAAIVKAYANPTANRNPYVDPVVDELAANSAYNAELTEANGANMNTEQHSYSSGSTAYHGGGGAHPDNTYHLIGIRTLKDSVLPPGRLGNAVIDPHAYINLLLRYTVSAQGNNVTAGIHHTSTHEIGHSVVPELDDDIHNGHSDVPWGNCCGTVGTLDVEWCPKHALQIRDVVTRSWPAHNNATANPAETASDSATDLPRLPGPSREDALRAIAANQVGDVQSSIVSALESYEPEDRPVLFFRFENVSGEVRSDFYPRAGVPEDFPSDLVAVFENGTRLPYRRTTERHTTPEFRTTLAPGQTYTVRIELDEIVDMPLPITGSYDAMVTDYYASHFTEAFERFDIRLPEVEPTSVVEWLASAQWQTNLDLRSSETRAELTALAAGPATPGLRVRALHLVADDAGAAAVLRAAINDAESMVALAALEFVETVPSRETAIALMKALEHRDVAVRRLAAEKLERAPLGAQRRATLERLAEEILDEGVRRNLARVLAR